MQEQFRVFQKIQKLFNNLSFKMMPKIIFQQEKRDLKYIAGKKRNWED